MVDGDEGGEDGSEDGLRIPPPGEKSWINLTPKMKIVVAAALCFANSSLLLGQPLFVYMRGYAEAEGEEVPEAPDRWAHAAKESAVLFKYGKISEQIMRQSAWKSGCNLDASAPPSLARCLSSNNSNLVQKR